MPPDNRLYGKYRGQVTDIVDPENLGRVKIRAPILGPGEIFAMPCTPFAGAKVGMVFTPPVGAHVWIEFEEGDPDKPIVSGCFWGRAGDRPGVSTRLEAESGFAIVGNGFRLELAGEGPGKGFTIALDKPLVDEKLSITMTESGIRLSGETATLVLNHAGAELASLRGQGKIELREDQVSVRADPRASIVLDQSSLSAKGDKIELTATTQLQAQTAAMASLLLRGPEVELKSAASRMSVNPAKMLLENGAAKVDVGPVVVNVNNGALEVI